MARKTRLGGFDLIVAGAGAAGVMAALQAAKKKRVLLLEQNAVIARKLALLRRGKGSVSHRAISHEHFKGRHERFAADALRAFDHEAMAGAFSPLGIELQESEGTIHAGGSGRELAARLSQALADSGVTVHCGTTVKAATRGKSGFTLETDKGEFKARKLVLALGAPHFPQLGGSESGVNIAQSLGHTFMPRHPALVGLKTKEDWPRRLPGLWMECELKLLAGAKTVAAHTGLVLFTAGSLAGPAIAAISRDLGSFTEQPAEAVLAINFYPEQSREDVATWLFRTFGQHTRMTLPDALDRMLPRRLAVELCKLAALDPKWRVNVLNEQQRKRLEVLLTDTRVTITETLGWRAAEGTRGGVNVREIDPKTFESKLCKGLYIVGETLDVDAKDAAMNVHFAMASGYCAGLAAASGR